MNISSTCARRSCLERGRCQRRRRLSSASTAAPSSHRSPRRGSRLRAGPLLSSPVLFWRAPSWGSSSVESITQEVQISKQPVTHWSDPQGRQGTGPEVQSVTSSPERSESKNCDSRCGSTHQAGKDGSEHLVLAAKNGGHVQAGDCSEYHRVNTNPSWHQDVPLHDDEGSASNLVVVKDMPAGRIHLWSRHSRERNAAVIYMNFLKCLN